MLEDLLDPTLTENARNPSTAKALRKRLQRELNALQQDSTVSKMLHATQKVSGEVMGLKPRTKNMLSKLDKLIDKYEHIHKPTSQNLAPSLTIMVSEHGHKPTGEFVYAQPQLHTSDLNTGQGLIGLGQGYISRIIDKRNRISMVQHRQSASLFCLTHHPIEQFLIRAEDNSFGSLFKCMQELDLYLSCVFPKDIPNSRNIYIPCAQGMFIGVKNAIPDTSDTFYDATKMKNRTQTIITTFVSNRMLFGDQINEVAHALKIGKSCLPDVNSELHAFLLSDTMSDVNINTITTFRLTLAKSFGFQMDLNDYINLIKLIETSQFALP